MKFKAILVLFIIFFNCNTSSKQSEEFSIDTKTIANRLTLFGQHIVSTPLYERDIAITPQGNELIYTLGDYKQTKRCLVSLQQKNGKWTNAQILNISGKYQDIEPFYTNDGNRLYFASNRPIYVDETRTDYNIWYSNRTKSGWSNPIALDSIINTRGDEFYPSLSSNGNLYFTATREDGIGTEDIFKSEFTDGKFQTPKPLPIAINTASYEFNAYISPDEDLLIFSSFGRPDGFGGGDLYISRKDSLGYWKKSQNLGEAINSDKLDFCPFIDWSSRNLYFTSERTSGLKNTLQRIDKLETLEEFANSPLNGFGNIYKIGLDKLE
jgi:hypothetical protein